MPAVRRALGALKELDLELWTEERGPSVAVSRSGEVFFNIPGYVGNVAGQRALDAELLDLIAPFVTEQAAAPDLYAPRPSLRIIPGKLSGSPHIVKTRIETIALAALEDRGLPESKIASLYPVAPPAAIANAVADAFRDIGATFNETPLTPRRVAEAIERARRAKESHR
jgi:uncharacterized protein (DUF433 family)